MSGSVLVGVVALVVVAVVGAYATTTAPAWGPGLVDRWESGRFAATAAQLRATLGPVRAFGSVALFGAGLMLLVLWPVGRLAKALEPHVDVPVFHWFQDRQVGGAWSHAWRTLTNIGSLDLTQGLSLLGAVVFAVLFARRGWWVPPVAFLGGYVMEKYLQQALKLVVDRGHPPTTLGSYPSGGCGRVLLVYGLLVFFALRWARVRSHRLWALGGSLVALAATVQAYARTYNLEHWVTDVFGGLLFGCLLLATVVAAASVALPAPAAGRPGVPPQRDDERTLAARQG